MQIRQLTQKKTFVAPTQLSPGFFTPNFVPAAGFGLMTQVGGSPVAVGNVDPRGAGILGLSDCPSWQLFYLPFGITITRYRFQVDATAADAVFFAGMYTSACNLIFDIGAVAIATAGQYTGTGFFDASNSAVGSVTLAAGWYLFGWCGRSTAASGTLHMPGTGPSNALWGEQIGIDTTGLPAGGLLNRRAHSAGFDTSGHTHMPATLGKTNGGGATTFQPNITFFA